MMCETHEREFTTSILAKRYGCSRSAMRHRISRNIAKLNRDTIPHAMQDIRCGQRTWTVDAEGVAILDTIYGYKNSEHTSKVSLLYKDITILSDKIDSLHNTIDTLISYIFNNKNNEKPSKRLDEQLDEFRKKDTNNTPTYKIYNDPTWKSQVNYFVENILSTKYGKTRGERYRTIYRMFEKEHPEIKLDDMCKTYYLTHKYSQDKKTILEVLFHNEPARILFTDFLNGLEN